MIIFKCILCENAYFAGQAFAECCSAAGAVLVAVAAAAAADADADADADTDADAAAADLVFIFQNFKFLWKNFEIQKFQEI